MKKYISFSVFTLVLLIPLFVYSASQDELIRGKELKTKTIQEIADFYEIDVDEYADALSKQVEMKVSPETDFKDLNLHPSFAKGLASAVKGLDEEDEAESSVNSSLTNNSGVENFEGSGAQQRSRQHSSKYPLTSLIIFLIVAYLITYFLSVKKIITLVTHRKIWNIVLLISFFISATLGILLAIRMSFDWDVWLPDNSIYIHVITGMVMAIVSFFHIIWHWRYFKNIFR